MQKTVLSFYVDDTNPYVAPPAAFAQFLDFVAGEGAAGESSVILGYDWEGHGELSAPREAVEEAYAEQARRAFACGIDSHCELYTHYWRYNFAEQRREVGGIHEGLWLYEPAVSAAEYEAYFAHILDHGERIGLRFSGLTWPGCGCAVCRGRYAELHAAGISQPNPGVWQALLNLARAGRFRGPNVVTFFDTEVELARATRTAGDGAHGVYTLPPNADDRFGDWRNDPNHVDADYYISADGQTGKIVEIARAGEPYCVFYTHWQGLNPANGCGWDAFTQVVRRVNQHLREQVAWMRPSQYIDSLAG